MVQLKKTTQAQKKKTYLLGALLILFFALLFFLLLKNISLQQDSLAHESLLRSEANIEALNFLEAFIVTVLKSEKPITIEERISLESKLERLNDEEIAQLWETFLASKTESEAQHTVVRLLETLVKKAQAR